MANHGGTNEATDMKGGDGESAILSQTIHSASMVSPMGQNTTLNVQQLATIDAPTPVGWLGDIAEHIKQLKEMNDF